MKRFHFHVWFPSPVSRRTHIITVDNGPSSIANYSDADSPIHYVGFHLADSIEQCQAFCDTLKRIN